MSLRNHALVGTFFTLFASSALAFGCSSADPNSLTSDTQSSAEDLRRHCRAQDDGYQSQCAASCMAWGDDDSTVKSCDAGAPKPPPTTTTTATTPPPPPPPPPPTSTATSTATTPPPPPPPPATCTSFTYSAWGACQPSGTQTRTVVSSSPAGCTGGSPVLSQSCTYIDGGALYTQYCSGCHGTSKKGSSVSAIQTAIANNTGGMGSLSFLTADQIAAISAAP